MGNSVELDRNPIALISMLYRYGREDFGTTYLYLPLPKRTVDREAWVWLQMLKSMGAARKRWLISSSHTSAVLGKTHAHLFEPSPVCFEAYRLNKVSLERVFERL
jgi:hypothetical protein